MSWHICVYMIHMYIMIRTQIYIPENMYKKIMLLSETKETSMASTIRSLIKLGFSDTKTKNIDNGLIKLSKINGIGSSDLSSNIDKYLYEE